MTIENEHQLGITMAWVARFRTALEEAKARGEQLFHHDVFHRAYCDSLASQLADLEDEIAEYRGRHHA